MDEALTHDGETVNTADEILTEHERATNRRIEEEVQQELQAQEGARHADEILEEHERATNR